MTPGQLTDAQRNREACIVCARPVAKCGEIKIVRPVPGGREYVLCVESGPCVQECLRREEHERLVQAYLEADGRQP